MIKEPPEENNSSAEKSRKKKTILWLKRIGIGGFMFFLIKGLVWLAVIFGIGKWSCH
jgi:hypothetical protein